MFKRILTTGSLVFILAAFVCIPIFQLLVLAGNLALSLLVLSLQFIATILPRRNPRKLASIDREPFISIHVPAHNEPPELLKETLRSLARLEWENFEVIVIDNNTSDAALWRPIEEYCRGLGPRFRFFHVENLKGFKAGAMNYVRPFIDVRAEFIFVVDADYLVEPTALKTALQYYTSAQIGLIQFPQNYRNTCKGNEGIALDLKHFFSGYMTMANVMECVPSTGTLSLISVPALQAIGGFDTNSITEDADLGYRLNIRGFRTVFANENIGTGVLPHDLEGLKKQRWRWAFGNAQILKRNWRELLLGNQLKLRQKLGFLTHLTAWFNFNLIPSIFLMLLTPLTLFATLSPIHELTVIICGSTVLSFLLLRFGILYFSLGHEGHSLHEIRLAYLTHLGLGWVFSASWIKCLWDHRSPFVRTNKFVGDRLPGSLRATIVELMLGVGLLIACAVLTLSDLIIGPIAALLMGCIRFLIYWVAHQSKQTWAITRQTLSHIEPSLADERLGHVSANDFRNVTITVSEALTGTSRPEPSVIMP